VINYAVFFGSRKSAVSDRFFSLTRLPVALGHTRRGLTKYFALFN